MIKLYTPATGFPDLEAKIAYGLARVGIETFGMEKATIQDNGGFYTIAIDTNEDEFDKIEKTFNMLCKRLLSSSYIPFSTPGVAGRSAEGVSVTENEIFSLDSYRPIIFNAENKKSENICRHNAVDDNNGRKERIKVAIEAYRYLISGQIGASLSHAVPHGNPLEILVAYSETGPLPFPISPMYSDYISKTSGLMPQNTTLLYWGSNSPKEVNKKDTIDKIFTELLSKV
ncbi:MAG: hypothetical protein AB1397_06725 [bacterium]